MNDSHCSQTTEIQPTLSITSSERIDLGGNRHGNSIDLMEEMQRCNHVAFVNSHLIFTRNGAAAPLQPSSPTYLLLLCLLTR